MPRLDIECAQCGAKIEDQLFVVQDDMFCCFEHMDQFLKKQFVDPCRFNELDIMRK